jgi:hypothetical protein
MSVIDSVLSVGNVGVLEQLASQFGIDEDQARSAVSALLPAIAGGLMEKLTTPRGAALSSLISGGSLSKFADNPASLVTAGALTQGNSMLNQVFGGAALTKMAATVAKKVGINSSVITAMLPTVTALLGGLLYKSTADGQHNLTEIVDALASSGHSSAMDGIKGFASKVVG